jgi:hypothetical protein
MRIILFLYLSILRIASCWSQDAIAVFDYKELLLTLPGEAFPLSPSDRIRILDTLYDKKDQEYLKNIEIPLPVDTSVETTYSQFAMYDRVDGQISMYFEFKIYLTATDTFLISVFRAYSENRSHPFILKAYKMDADLSFEEISLPVIKPTDYAKTPKDSVIISTMIATSEASFYPYFENPFQRKGIYFRLTDHTLNTGPFEPPVTKPEKYYSDYKTIDHPIGIFVTSKGLIYED